MFPPIKRTPPSLVPYAVMYRWPWEADDEMRDPPEVGVTVIRVPMQQIEWRMRFGWRLIIDDTDVELTLGPGQEWAPYPVQAKKAPPFYPPPIMRPPDVESD